MLVFSGVVLMLVLLLISLEVARVIQGRVLEIPPEVRPALEPPEPQDPIESLEDRLEADPFYKMEQFRLQSLQAQREASFALFMGMLTELVQAHPTRTKFTLNGDFARTCAVEQNIHLPGLSVEGVHFSKHPPRSYMLFLAEHLTFLQRKCEGRYSLELNRNTLNLHVTLKPLEEHP